MSGRISIPENIDSEELPLKPFAPDTTGLPLNLNDIYKEFRLRGCDFHGKFRGIIESDPKFTTGKLLWQDDWVSLIDTMLQFSDLGKHHSRDLYLPTRIDRIVLNPLKHQEIVHNLKQSQGANGTVAPISVYMYKNMNVIKAGGIEIRGLKTSLTLRRFGTQPTPILQRYTFVPRHNDNATSSKSPECAHLHAISVITQLAIENSVGSGTKRVKVVDVIESRTANDSLAQIIQSIIENEPSLISDMTIIANQSIEPYVDVVDGSRIQDDTNDPSSAPIESNDYHLVIAYDVVERPNATAILKNLKASIRENGFVLLEENIIGYDETKANRSFASLNLTIVSLQCSTTKKYILLRRIVDISTRNKIIIWLTGKNFNWLEALKSALATAERENRYVYLVGQGEECLGAVGLMNCIKNEIGGKMARLVFIQDANVEEFSFASETFANQLKTDLISNVYKNGDWGTYRHLELEELGNYSKTPIDHAHLDVLTCGDQSNLAWIESPSFSTENEQVELCTVYYAPVNSSDVIMSTGKMTPDGLHDKCPKQDGKFGLEFAGRDSNGRRKF